MPANDLESPKTVKTSEVARTSVRRRVGRSIVRDKRLLTGLLLVGFTAGVVLLGRSVAPYGSTEFVDLPFSAPSSHHLLGTDVLGRDVLSRVLSGGTTVVVMSLLTAVLGVTLGAAIGVSAGFHRGWVDQLLMRSTDVMLALPTIVFVLLFVSVFGNKLWMLVVLVAVAHAAQVARVLRGVTLDVREQEYIEYAEAVGASPLRIILTQVLPSISAPLRVEFGLRTVWSIVIFASLSVLGQGVSAPTADWGLMVNENRGGLAVQPYAVLAPLVMIAIFAIGVNLLTESAGRSKGRVRSETAA